MSDIEGDLHADLLEGAEAIAGFIWGPGTPPAKLYRLMPARRIPVFRFGGVICARRSTLIAWIAEQEAAHGGTRPRQVNGSPGIRVI